MKKKLFLILFSFLFLLSKAQTQCVDSTRIDPYFYCYYEFHPVCGCNQVTYANPCSASRQGGVNYFNDGPCKDFYFDFYPNPVGTSILSGMNFNLQFKDKGDVNITIMDLFGTIYFQRMRSGISSYQEQLQLDFMKDGVYFLVVRSGSTQQVKKFLKIVY